MPLFTKTEKNNNNQCFGILYSQSDLNTTQSQHLLKKTIQIQFNWHLEIQVFPRHFVNNAQLLELQGSETIRLLETKKSLGGYILIHNTNNNNHHHHHLPLIQMFIINRTLRTSIPEDNEKI